MTAYNLQSVKNFLDIEVFKHKVALLPVELVVPTSVCLIVK